jgi:predicted AAA+ superfamily ATPase
MKYIQRVSDKELLTKMKAFGAVVIEGPKWCGKTWTGTKYSKSVFEVADPEENFSNREYARMNPSGVLDGELPRLIDEWQEVPSLWDAVRYTVDKKSLKGAYILTGSSVPNDDAIIHSGTARLVKMKMSTMTLGELGESKNEVSFNEIISNDKLSIEIKKNSMKIDKLMELTIRGGWPSMINEPTNLVMKLADGYLDSVANSDVSRVDGVVRDPSKVKALLRSLARNVATTVSNDSLIKDIASTEASVSANAMTDYIRILKRIFVLDEIPAWNPALKSPVRLRQAPKRFLFDSSLTVAGLGASVESLRNDIKLFGNIFESFALHELLVYARANDAQVFHYNDNSNLEVDAIIEKRNGDWTAIEIKLSNYYEDTAAENLLRLKKKMLDGGEKAPINLVIITGTGGALYRRDDGVLVVPIASLGV